MVITAAVVVAAAPVKIVVAKIDKEKRINIEIKYNRESKRGR